jgi:PAS domain S-box-containing protein/putative nucleotidyltransferase with HDIG domain
MGHRKHIFLVVDDKIENLISLKALIKEAFPESEILTAQSGKDALELINECEPDVILLDIMMPDMDGYEVCRKVKADDVSADIPVVFVTALKNDKQTRIKALQSGAEAFLNKPIDEIELLAQLSNMLKIRELNFKKKETINILGSDLKKNTQKFNILAEEINDAMIFIDMDGKIRDVNRAATEKYGYSYEEFLTMNVLDLRREKDSKRISKQMETAAEEGNIFEAIHYKRDNSAFNVEVSSKGTIIGDEKILLSIVRDITKRKKEEETLRDSEKKYRTLFESGSGAILLFTEGRWVDCNEKALDTFGCTRDQIIGEHPIRFSPPKQPDGRSSDEESIKMIDLAYSKGPQFFEWVHCRADGSLFDAEVSLKRVDLEGKPYIQAIVLDITERKQTQKELFESEMKYRTIFENAIECIFESTREGRALSANPAFVKLLGYESEEDVINSLTDLANQFWVKPTERDYVRNMIEKQGYVNGYECELKCKDGKTIIISLNVTASRTSDGQVRLHGSFEDITQRKQVELDLLERKLLLEQSQSVGHIGSWMLDIPTNQLTWSDETFRIFGLTPQESNVTYEYFLSCIHPDDRDAVDAAYTQSIQQGKDTYDIEHRIVNSKTGEIRQVYERCGHERDQHGVIIRSIGMIQDITVRKHAEGQLKRAQALNKSIIESTNDFVWTVDAEHFAFTSFNSALRKYFLQLGIDLKIGMIAEDINPSTQFVDTWHALYERVLCDGPYSQEYAAIDGKTHLLLTFGLLHQDENVFGISVFGKDITERKRAEENVEQSNRNLITILNSSLFGVTLISKNKEIQWANLEGIKMMGFASLEDIVGKKCFEYFCPALEYRCPILDEGQQIDNSERSIKRVDGEIIPIIKSVTMVRIDEEELLLETFIDITELKNNELELQKTIKQNQRILENLQDAYFQADISGNFTIVNPMAVNMYGYDSEDELLGQPASSLYADAEERDKLIASLKGKGKQNDYVAFGLRKDGSSFPVSMNVQFVQNDNGEIIGTEGLARDITEREKAETAIRLEAERYNAMIESTTDWIFVVAPENYTLTLFNTSVAKYFKKNYNVTLQIGMSFEEFLPEKRRNLWKGFIDKAVSEGRFSTEYRSTTEVIHFILSLAPVIIDNVTVGVSVFGKDITNEHHYKEELEKTNQILLKRFEQTINAISRIGELRDVYTAGHQRRVKELACAIAQEMGLSHEVVKNISDGAIIHDIGKIYIASDILNKPGKITNLEYQILQTHVDHGYDIVKNIDFPCSVIEMIHQHHERMDGTGYPNKLSGDQIIIESRILAVADVVEAMNSHRPYRPALGIDKALEEIMLLRGEKFDSGVVDVCVRLFKEKHFEFTNDILT